MKKQLRKTKNKDAFLNAKKGAKKVVGRPFEKGHPGGPGRPKGSGRSQALAVLDEVCENTKVKSAIRKELMKKALQNPLAFFMKIVVPLLPKELSLDEKSIINIYFRKDGNNDPSHQ